MSIFKTWYRMHLYICNVGDCPDLANPMYLYRNYSPIKAVLAGNIGIQHILLTRLSSINWRVASFLGINTMDYIETILSLLISSV